MTLHNTLYVLPDGTPKDNASYSARATYKHCKRLFYLTRVRGWRSRIEGVALDLGKITEAAVVNEIKYGEGGPELFRKLWIEYKGVTDFTKKRFTKVEQDWENCLRIGIEWLTIFHHRAHTYPFASPQFQVPLSKKIFPQTSYDPIRNVAYLDLYSEPDPKHPMLVRVANYPGLLRPLVTDIKTASAPLPEHLVALDPQLIEYAWMYKNPKDDGQDVAFLWFVKKSNGMKFGSRVTMLAGHGPYVAGSDAIVLDKVGSDVWIGTPGIADAYAKACAGPDGASLTGKKLDVAATRFLEGCPGVRVPQASVSKQVVQFASARLNLQAIEEMGKVVGQTTVEMVVSHEQGFYPMEPGLRYPSDKCSRCDMRFICAGDDDGRDKFLLRYGQEFEDTTEEK